MESTPLYSFFNVCAPPTRLLHPSEGGGGGEANGGRLRMLFVFFFSTGAAFRPFLPFLAAAHRRPLLTFSRFTFCCRLIVTHFILSLHLLPPLCLLLDSSSSSFFFSILLSSSFHRCCTLNILRAARSKSPLSRDGRRGDRSSRMKEDV